MQTYNIKVEHQILQDDGQLKMASSAWQTALWSSKMKNAFFHLSTNFYTRQNAKLRSFPADASSTTRVQLHHLNLTRATLLLMLCHNGIFH
jgi:hypothetical protein